MYFTQHWGVKYKVYAGMPNPDKHVVQNPPRPKIQARWSGIYINRLRRMCKAAQENSFPAYSLQMSDIRGSRSFLMMIKGIVHKLFSFPWGQDFRQNFVSLGGFQTPPTKMSCTTPHHIPKYEILQKIFLFL